ncbi:unnamed protein product [Closterium sp. NIES-54]
MGLVLGGRGPVVLTGHADASWVDDSATQRSSQGYTFSLGSSSVSWRSTRSSSVLSSSCEAEIYAGAMAPQELRWLTYLLTDLGEQPRSPPVLYVDNKAMIALCQEHRLEHRTKHIALRYFLARELQQRGQLRLVYVATRANTADVFTKALPPGDHQRFVTMLGLDVTFDESVPFYRLFPYLSTPPPPPALFLAPGPPPVDPLPPQGPAPSGVSQVDPLPGPAPVHVAVGSGADRGAASGSAASGGAGSEGAETGGAEHGGVGTGGAEPGGAEPEGVEPGGAVSEGAESGGAEPQGAASSRGSAGASPRLSPQQLREWFVRRASLRSGATGAGGAGAAGAGGAGVAAGASGAGGAVATGPGGARTRGTGAAGAGGVEGAGVVGPGVGGAGAAGAGVGGIRAGGTGVVDPCAGGAGGTVRPRPYFVPLLQEVLGAPSSTGLTPPLLCPPPDLSQPPLQPASPLPAPSPYTEQSGGLTMCREPASRPVSPVRTARCVPCSLPPPDPGMHAMALRPSSVPLRVPLRLLLVRMLSTALVAESASSSPSSVGGECALGTDVLEDRQEDFQCLAAAVPRFASMLLAPEGDPDAPDIPTPRSYAEANTGPYSSQWQAAMDAEMASWKSTGTYVDEVPPPGANIVDGMWIFRVKRPPGSPPAFKARYVA